MAWAALTSLPHTIRRVLYDWEEPFQHVDSLKDDINEKLEGSRGNSKRLEALDAQIRDEVYKFEDALESHWLDKLLSQSEDLGSSRDDLILFDEVREQFERFKEALEKIVESVDESDDTSALQEEEEEEEDLIDSTTTGFEGNKPKRVRFFNDKLTEVGYQRSYSIDWEKINVFSLVGTEGTGRTILARSVFNDPDICTYFERRAWVTIAPNCQYKEILTSILAQIDPQGSHDSLLGKEEFEIYNYLGEIMRKERKRCLIVMDFVQDIWINPMRLWRVLIQRKYNDCRVLMTVRERIPFELGERIGYIYELRVLSKEESWDLLCKLVFAPQLCPPALVKAGKKIAANCKGLAVEIAKTALFLSSTEKTPEHWDNVAAEMEVSISKEEYDEMSEISKEVKCSDSTDYARIVMELLGLSYAIDYVKMNLITTLPKPNITSLLGMVGIGKTFHAKRIFEDPSSNFDCCVWVTVGQNCRTDRILADIIDQIDDNENMLSRGDEKISSKRCLIVLDDLWSTSPVFYLDTLPPCFKYEILLTTRLERVASLAGTCHKIPLLNKEESWNLLCKQVFAENSCPRELKEAGEVIAENCDGLPLLIVTVGRILSEAEKTPKYWKEAAKKRSEVFENAYDKIMKVLLPSYWYLSLEQRQVFLYLGTLPQNYEIRPSRLLWFCYCDQIISIKSDEYSVVEYVKELVSSSLVLVIEEKYRSQIKIFRLHLVFWNMCIREARKIKFFHVLNSRADAITQDIKSQRRLSIQNSVLFGLKDVHKSIASVSHTRSLLCTGPPHRYSVPICYGLQFLRVLNALSVRLYKFPLEVLNLVLLRLLALNCDEELPPSIHKLKKLECLIVRRHMCIRVCGTPSCLPVEIQRMRKLKHLRVLGSTLPDHCGDELEKLLVLLDVIANHSTKSFLQGTPYLRELGIRIEVLPDAFVPLFSFDHIPHLKHLTSLKCVVVNPTIEHKFPPPASLQHIPTSLVKLSLNGFGYPWESINYIASRLNYLKELKLRSYAFRGREWVMHETDFKSLEYLLLEDTDLELWRIDSEYCCMKLHCLTIRHCYKLQGIPPQCEISEIKVVPAEMGTLSTDYLDRRSEYLNPVKSTSKFLLLYSIKSDFTAFLLFDVLLFFLSNGLNVISEPLQLAF